MKANGAAVGDIAPAEWHGLRVVNILVDYAQMRMRLSSSERSEVEAIRRDMYRDLGLDPHKQYARRRDGKVYEMHWRGSGRIRPRKLLDRPANEATLMTLPCTRGNPIAPEEVKPRCH